MGKQAHELQVERVPVGDLIPYPGNARHGDIGAICQSLQAHGQYRPLVVQASTSYVIAGNHTLAAAVQLGWTEIAITRLDVDDEQAKRILLVDNRTQDLATNDDSALAALLEELAATDEGLDGTGFDGDDLDDLLADLDAADKRDDYDGNGEDGALSDRFMVPPFSILDARKGWWRDRKKRWLGLGIESEIGRDADLMGGFSDSAARAGFTSNGTSVFDPVLCELIYRWFSPPGGTVLDPFAGGSVRGIMAAKLGRQYIGTDLRGEQVEANRAQAEQIITSADEPAPVWIEHDATRTSELDLPAVDLVFSCPPYADLEVYSDDPRDLSTMSYGDFRQAHAQAIRQACERLKDDSFAVWVVGEARGKDGGFYGFVPDTVRAFMDAGLQFATEGFLVTPTGSLALRAGRNFTSGRTLGRTHQNVLVFCKGDRKRAAERLGEVDVADALAEAMEEEGGDDGDDS